MKAKESIKRAMRDDGAELILGDLDFSLGGDLATGFFFEPMVIEGIKFDSAAFHDEYFAPVFSLYRVKDAEEAL
jgi:succinate-semialdehyde dehydrogenase / glutarate-semialdehyde dehydrogenase